MHEDLFELLERTLRSEGPGAGFDLLIRTLLERKSYPLIFEARLMQKRHALGLPLIFAGTISDLPSEHQSAYQAALTDAARETGSLYLADGDIVRAWTYFRAIGEPAPVAAAIEKVRAGEGMESVLAIALHEGVNPRKGFDLLLERRGICQGIDFATQCPDRENHLMFWQLVSQRLYD